MSLFVLGYDPGAVHRWAALLRFDGKARPVLVAVYEVPESREGVHQILCRAMVDAANNAPPGYSPSRDFRDAAIERPKGVAHGDKLACVKGKGANLIETMNAAERFACIAWSRSFKVHEHTASEVRQALCCDKSASDAMVKAAVEANVQGVAVGPHARDAEAVALFVGAKLAGYSIRHTAALFKAKAKRTRKSAVRKLGPSVAKAMREQGYR